MRKSTITLAAALIALAVAGSGAALAATGAATTRHVRAEVVSVDQAAKTLTVKTLGHKVKELTFAVDSAAAAGLGDLKPGERVTVTYARSGTQMTATAITKVHHAASK